MAEIKDISQPQHVLFVGDDREHLDTLRETFGALSEGRWQSHTVAGADAALEQLKAKKIELVVVDAGKPAPDGGQLVGLLRRNHPKLKLAVLASSAGEQERAASLATGADLCLEKPASPEGLQAVFAALCELLHWSPPAGSPGATQHVCLKDLIQMECLGGNSSIVELYREHSLGRIYIEAGRVIHAVCGELAGERAFQKLLAQAGCVFELLEFSPPTERTIYSPPEFLLAEAARQRELLAQRAAVAGLAENKSGDRIGQAAEMLVCLGTGEPVYDWQCLDLAARVDTVKKISELAAQLIPDLQLGYFDRLELQLPAGRAILQARDDRMVFVRLAEKTPGQKS